MPAKRLENFPSLEWGRYACVASGCWYGWNVDRVCSDPVKNVINALDRLQSYGYERVGMVLNQMYTQSDGLGTKWGTGYLGYHTQSHRVGDMEPKNRRAARRAAWSQGLRPSEWMSPSQ